jgi:hypothetical protein
MGEVLIQVSPAGARGIYGADLTRDPPRLESFKDRADEIAETITEVATSLKEQLDRRLTRREGLVPDQVDVEFGLELQAGASAVITRVTAGCTFKVRLAWTRSKTEN